MSCTVRLSAEKMDASMNDLCDVDLLLNAGRPSSHVLQRHRTASDRAIIFSCQRFIIAKKNDRPTV